MSSAPSVRKLTEGAFLCFCNSSENDYEGIERDSVDDVRKKRLKLKKKVKQ